MRRNIPAILVTMVITLLMISCKQVSDTSVNQTADTVKSVVNTATEIRDTILKAHAQKELSPDAVIQMLKDGNAYFIRNNVTKRDHAAMVMASADGQYPMAVILSCLDSRVPVEDVFNKSIGDLFIARVAGNVVNEDILGSMEYGCKVAGAKVIVVMGHGSCGAVKAAIDDVKMGNITGLVTKIKPAVAKSQNYEGMKSSKDHDFVSLVAKNNVFLDVEKIKAKSPILKEMSDKGEIKIVAAFYDLETGIVTFL
jgi:carbonic anhydrase